MSVNDENYELQPLSRDTNMLHLGPLKLLNPFNSSNPTRNYHVKMNTTKKSWTSSGMDHFTRIKNIDDSNNAQAIIDTSYTTNHNSYTISNNKPNMTTLQGLPMSQLIKQRLNSDSLVFKFQKDADIFNETSSIVHDIDEIHSLQATKFVPSLIEPITSTVQYIPQSHMQHPLPGNDIKLDLSNIAYGNRSLYIAPFCNIPELNLNNVENEPDVNDGNNDNHEQEETYELRLMHILNNELMETDDKLHEKISLMDRFFKWFNHDKYYYEKYPIAKYVKHNYSDPIEINDVEKLFNSIAFENYQLE